MEVEVDEPDPRVVEAARNGDVSAYETLVRSYQRDVWRLAFHLLRDRGLADDATQETFVRTFRHIRRFRGRSKFSTWLFSVARNAAIDELRRLQRRDRIEQKLHEQPAPGQEPSSVSDVRDAIGKLPEDLREVVVMIDLLGFNYRDAGIACGIPEGTVKSRVHRARRKLATMLHPTTHVPKSDEAADES